MTLEEMMEKYPTNWQISGDNYICDANGKIVPSVVKETLVEAVNRVAELKEEIDDIASGLHSLQDDFVRVCAERDSLKAKVEELEAKVTRWTNSSKHWAECHDRLLSENADIESRCTSLEQALADKVIAWTGARKAQSDADDMHRHLYCKETQRRFEAACAFGASHYGRGMFSAEPSAIAAFAVKYADALIAELAKPNVAAKEGTT